MKKKLFFVIIGIISLIILFFIAQNSKKNIMINSTFVQVMNKEITNKKDFIITVIDIYSNNDAIPYNIIVQDENVWNLISLEETYFIVYNATKKDKIILQQIKSVE